MERRTDASRWCNLRVHGLTALGMLLLMEFGLACVLTQFAEGDGAGGWIAGFFAKFATVAGVIGAGF